MNNEIAEFQKVSIEQFKKAIAEHKSNIGFASKCISRTRFCNK